jgi:hypothetical protein
MRKLALVLATSATLVVSAVATPSPAHARCYGCGIAGGLLAGALIAGIASSAYAYGPGYGYYGYPAYYGGYDPAYYGGYYPGYYGGYYPRYYGGYAYRPYYGYRRVFAPRYAYYGGPRYYRAAYYRGWRRW